MIRKVQDAIDAILFCDFERGQLIFRGQTNSNWDILPTLFRETADFRRATLFETVSMGPLFFKDKVPFLNTYDPIQQLIVAQHYGLPTRLVDWTYDILIGLFFACYDPLKQQVDQHGRLTLADKSVFTNLPLNAIALTEYKNPLTPDRIAVYTKRLQIDTIYIIEPLVRNPRIRVQEGCVTSPKNRTV